jgi:hypothetical protein
MRLPTAQENTMIAAGFVPSTTYYFALFTTDPGTTGASGEVTGGTGPYARQALVFGSASGGVEASTNAQNFTGMPAATVPYAAIFSLLSGGTYEGGMALGASLTVPAGATVACAIGAVTVSQS